jgi:hypothetical protein
MEKEVKIWRGQRYFLLGEDIDGDTLYLCEASWECSWYWGFGYVETFNKRWTDITSHRHADGLFLKNYANMPSLPGLAEQTVQGNEAWVFIELLKSFYVLKEGADIFGRGGAHITENPAKRAIKNTAYAKRINEKMLPAIFEEIYKLLTPEVKNEEISTTAESGV